MSSSTTEYAPVQDPSVAATTAFLGALALCSFVLLSLRMPIASEIRYIESGREMAESGDWIVPTLGGEPFMEKPPLYYLTAALFGKLFSFVLPLHDAARLTTGFFMSSALLLTGLTGRELWG